MPIGKGAHPDDILTDWSSNLDLTRRHASGEQVGVVTGAWNRWWASRTVSNNKAEIGDLRNDVFGR